VIEKGKAQTRAPVAWDTVSNDSHMQYAQQPVKVACTLRAVDSAFSLTDLPDHLSSAHRAVHGNRLAFPVSHYDAATQLSNTQ
jgi:hypothetical protein